jgi:hypothetical protein
MASSSYDKSDSEKYPLPSALQMAYLKRLAALTGFEPTLLGRAPIADLAVSLLHSEFLAFECILHHLRTLHKRYQFLPPVQYMVK